MSVNVHASCVVVADAGLRFGAPGDAGILLLGDSGAGKSDIALGLIARGARLVADDRTELFARDGHLWARPVPALAGLLEARGLGIVALPFAESAHVSLVVRLVERGETPRMPDERRYEVPAALPIGRESWPPLIALSGRDASAPDKIVLAVAAFANALFRS